MGLFGKLSGNRETKQIPAQIRESMTYKMKTVYCPMEGQVIALGQVADPVFSAGTMGAGVGIEPINGKLYAPADATVVMIFPTRHAIGKITEPNLGKKNVPDELFSFL